MAFDGTYYKVYQFKKLFFQRASGAAIVETEFPWPNKLAPNGETQTFTWQGGAQRKDLVVLVAQRWTLDLDAVPSAAHASLFGKSEITDAGAADAYFDVSTLVGLGGGNDTGGVQVGMRAVANAIKGASEETIELNLWAPLCTVTLTQAMGLNTDGTADKTQYSISATKTAEDITGAAIVGASSSGEFFFIGEAA